jgi:hypothetical protein
MNLIVDETGEEALSSRLSKGEKMLLKQGWTGGGLGVSE